MPPKTFAKFTKVEIVDKDGNAIDITSDGKFKIEDNSTVGALREIINLLGKIERHLAIVTEEDIDDNEILIKE